MRLATLCCLLLSGCCCNPFSRSESSEEWDQAVTREENNRQTEALVPGTVNVFEVAISLPEGLTQAQQDAEDERQLKLEVAQLELQVSEKKKAKGLIEQDERDVPNQPPEVVEATWAPILARQRLALDELQRQPSPTPGPLEVRERIRFVALYPPVPMIEEAGFSGLERCGACLDGARRRQSLLLRSFGFLPFQPRRVSKQELTDGLVLAGSLSLGSFAEATTTPVGAPQGGRAVLRLVDHCAANVVRVTDSVSTGNGSGVIAVPQYEERTWYELKETRCAGSGETERTVVGTPVVSAREKSPLMARVFTLRAVLAGL